MTPSDLELLQRFTRDRAQDAFTELVQRHLNLVYSAALRQVRSPQLAEEIVQSVFADLARVAATPSSPFGKGGSDASSQPTSLTPWLFTVTRHTAVDVIRKESRRQLREQIAVEMNAMNAETADWNQIEPLLDEAVAALDETDRAAVLLRFFENKSLRSVGQQLGVSDDAAQKRVSRAVERLREFFAKRGVTVGAGGLVVVISANAVQAAPVGLAVTVSAAALAGTAASTSTLIAATTKTIAMTTLQKTLVTATVAVLAGAGIYEAKQAQDARSEVQMLQQQQVPLAEQIQRLQNNFADATNRLADLLTENSRVKPNSHQNELLKLRGEVTRLRNEANDPTASLAKNWLENVSKLKQRFDEKPNARIPEFQFLTDKEWLSASSGKLQTEVAFRRAMASLRASAEQDFITLKLEPAMKEYSKANNGQIPTGMDQLQPYFSQPIDEAILQRWKIVDIKSAPIKTAGSSWVVTQKAPVDDVFDTRFSVTLRGTGSAEWVFVDDQRTLAPVYQSFDAANPNHNPESPTTAQLLPYAKTPEQQAALQKLILKESATSD